MKIVASCKHFLGRSRAAALSGGLLAAGLFLFVPSFSNAEEVQFVYTSDQHYGITRSAFRGQDKVSSRDVNAAMVQAINALPDVVFPQDGGVRAGEPVRWADLVVSTGDIANRMEGTDARLIPSAQECWQMFEDQYIKGITLRDAKGNPAEVVAVPGNHDVTDAVGFYRAMTPPTDNSSVVAMYNRTAKDPITSESYDFKKNKVFFTRNIGGVQMLFVQMWPDSTARGWIKTQLKTENPALLFTHDQPNIEAKHLQNPKGGINKKDKFENLVDDISSVESVKFDTLKEQGELAGFLKENPSIVAYFHGNENFNEFYTWKGPDNNISLPVFRVDSPMKGNESSKDEKKLSFQMVSMDTDQQKMTVREVLWNADPSKPAITWGASTTICYK